MNLQDGELSLAEGGNDLPPLAARMARRIEQHIRLNGLTEGHHLAAQELADLFRVSRAPVTAALKALEETGTVRSIPNRGFFVASTPPPAPPAEEVDEDPLYKAIADDRLTGALPERATENEMMRRYSVTRGRLQRTLTQIAEEGWVERLPGHGWHFRSTLQSAKAYDQAYRFRSMVETQALLEPGYAYDPRELKRLRREQQALLDGQAERISRAELFAINSGLHESLVAWSDNSFLLDALKRVNRLRSLLESRLPRDRARFQQQCREHLALLDLIERGDLALAADFLRGHIDHALALKERDAGRLVP